jgi:SAM-dependent methyltransferase
MVNETLWATIPVDVDLPSPNARRVEAGLLPRRYAESWVGPFFDLARPALRPGMSILDIGSGRRPTMPLAWRPSRSCYAGLDVSQEEIEAAGPGSYDETVVGDICSAIPELVNRFDLILSWQVLEHVRDMEAALRNIRSYLVPGGRLVALLSGSYAAFALLARVTPYSVRVRAMTRLLGLDPDTKFPTRYDRCTYRALSGLLSSWGTYEILPRYRAAGYFRFWPFLERRYLAYENWLCATERSRLATHYLISAVR